MQTIGAGNDRTGQRSDVLSGPRRSSSGQQLERNRAERKDVGWGRPVASCNPFRRTVRPADRSANPDTLEGVDDAEAGGASLVWCNEDVTRMERAVSDTGPARDIDRFGQLPDDPHHRVVRGGRVVPHRDIERLGGDVFFGAIGDGALHAGSDRLDDRRLEQLRLRRVRELVGQCLRLLRRHVESEDLDRHQAITRGLVRAEYRTERADANLMQDPEGSKRRRRSECGRIVSGQ